jgi:flagellar protein FliT
MPNQPTPAHEQVDASQLIANYESLLALSGQMRQAAVHGEWDQLISLEQARTRALAALKPLDAAVNLGEAESRQKDQIIEKILIDDSEIRRLTERWMQELQLDMQSNRQERLLLDAYGA